ncbi:MAG: IS1595 family transposase [Methylocella sp.]
MTCDLANPIFTDEVKATAHMEADRWPDGAYCPHCGSVNVHKMAGKTQAGMFLCNECREKFTCRTGTVFERSHIPLHKWLLATHLMAASKKGMSALQLSRMLGLSYKSSWFMCHRIREGMKPASPSPIGGENKVVESDETFIGGKARNRAYAKKEPKKHAVMTLVERDGESRSFHVANVKAKTLREKIVTTVSRKSHLMTDELASYEKVGKEFANHGTVNHSADEYVRLGGFEHINTAECRFSLMKRAVFATHHSISEAHLPRYLAEWDFKWNTRKMKDGERAALPLKGAEGKRLTYRGPRGAAHV